MSSAPDISISDVETHSGEIVPEMSFIGSSELDFSLGAVVADGEDEDGLFRFAGDVGVDHADGSFSDAVDISISNVETDTGYAVAEISVTVRIERLQRSESELQVVTGIVLVNANSEDVFDVDVGGNFKLGNRHTSCIGDRFEHGAGDRDVVGDLVRRVLGEGRIMKLARKHDLYRIVACGFHFP